MEADLSAVDPDIVVAAILDASFYADPTWIFRSLLTLAEDRRSDVRRAALMGFGALARRGELQTDRRVCAALLANRHNPAFGGDVDNVIQDLEMFGAIRRVELVAAVGWKPFLEVQASGGSSWLGCDPADQWVIGGLANPTPKKLSQVPYAAFPLLELPWPEVQLDVMRASTEAGSEMPLGLVLDAALLVGSYWPTQVVEWIEAGYPPEELMETLASVVTDRRLSQRVRHRIRRIL